ncbi:Dna2/Cas4 domain-containing protein [Scytonema sp. UIC 10036]|uniref:CRISPR-associated protein Cas4 n=1 Tax=Scytonema sp. UIC 10036 TaxID=2304196 RepID=UPI0012DACEAE|nr:Dna2/Cas4 domain-containing protein [Scytonema sp. UIC 10036]MUG92766.1 Dna2/Cas4 domain-containing protein [Scytonema sp. UIC 10036]
MNELEQEKTASQAMRRDATYIWVTWLTPLLAGSSFCQWAAWFQANYTFEKPQSDFSEWRIKHGRLLNKRVRNLENQGYEVYIEDENKFTITGQDGITKVAGKADIVAIKGNQVIVEDCKTGQKRDADVMQVLTYMLLLAAPGGPSHCRGKKLEGRLIYGDEVIDVPSEMLDRDFKDSFREIVHLVSASSAPRKVPSFKECQYCKVSSKYCPERITMQESEDLKEHDLF